MGQEKIKHSFRLRGGLRSGKLVWMINNGYSLDYCAKYLGRSELAILYRMDKLNLRRLSKEEIERVGSSISITV